MNPTVQAPSWIDPSWINLSWIDIGLLAFLALSVLFGLARGLVFEVLSALGWVVAYVAAMWGSPWALPYLRIGPPGSALNHGLAFACVFVLALILWSLAARLVRMLVRATPLSAFDRLLGAAFGFVRGLVVLLVVAAVVALTPWRSAPAWQRSAGVAWLEVALDNIKPWLPSAWAHRPAGSSAARI